MTLWRLIAALAVVIAIFFYAGSRISKKASTAVPVAARDLQVARVRLALIRDLPVSTQAGNVILTTQTVNASGVPQTQPVVLPGGAQANPFGVTP